MPRQAHASRGDSFDDALDETIIGLYKTELIRRHGPCKGIDDVRYATLEWVDWFNQRPDFSQAQELFYLHVPCRAGEI